MVLWSVVNGAQWRPVAAGAAAGLVVGTVALALGLVLDAVPAWSAMLGAVAGGATAAYVSRERLGRDVLAACLADVLSSVVVFVLGSTGVAALFALEDGKGAATAAVITPFALLFGSIVAVPVGLVSVVLAAVSGAVVSLLVTSDPGTTFTPRDRGK